jgi:hypothetical protein
MDFVSIELTIINNYKLEIPESYRIYANNDLLVERTTHWDTEYYIVNEKIAVAKVDNLELNIVHTLFNKLKKSREVNFNDIELPFNFQWIKINDVIVTPEVISAYVNPMLDFGFSNKIKITV